MTCAGASAPASRPARSRAAKWRRLPCTGFSLQLDDAVLDGEVHQLGAGLEAQGLHEVILVELDGPRRDAQLRRDLLRGLATGRQPQDLALPRREAGNGIGGSV